MLGLYNEEPTSLPRHEPELCMDVSSDGGVSFPPQSSQTISGPKWAFLPSMKIWEDSMSPHWPVLPPISPFRGEEWFFCPCIHLCHLRVPGRGVDVEGSPPRYEVQNVEG